MSDIVIKAENLSKYYKLGVINNGTLFRDIQTWWALKNHREDPHGQIGSHKYDSSKDGFWALKDLNFEIHKGDRVGIIGKNGAGKSTLLKILSRITAPTEGNLKIKGKVASLLEVGTGFHAELTGRENIYLNGAILGMNKSEVDRKIDEIISFSEIEQHIDTPVKRYSSGMYVRLAFAVAAHLDSEILVADEVLAVGDALFQKKALAKMNDLSTGEGRTVLFVSHNIGAVRNLCNKGIVLNHGTIITQDNIENAITRYLKPDVNTSGVFENTDIDPNHEINILRVELSSNGQISDSFDSTDIINIKIYYKVNSTLPFSNFSFQLYKEGYNVLHSWDVDTESVSARKELGEYVASFNLPEYLGLGNYSISLDCGMPNIGIIEKLENFLAFEIVNKKLNSTNKSLTRGGIINPIINWEVEKI